MDDGNDDGPVEVQQTNAQIVGVDNTNPESESTFETEAYAKLADDTEVAADSALFRIGGERIAKAVDDRTPQFTVTADTLPSDSLTAEVEAYATRNGETETDTDSQIFDFTVEPDREVKNTNVTIQGVDNTDAETSSTWNVEAFSKVTNPQEEVPADTSVLYLDNTAVDSAFGKRDIAFTVPAEKIPAQSIDALVESWSERNDTRAKGSDSQNYDFSVTDVVGVTTEIGEPDNFNPKTSSDFPVTTFATLQDNTTTVPDSAAFYIDDTQILRWQPGQQDTTITVNPENLAAETLEGKLQGWETRQSSESSTTTRQYDFSLPDVTSVNGEIGDPDNTDPNTSSTFPLNAQAMLENGEEVNPDSVIYRVGDTRVGKWTEQGMIDATVSAEDLPEKVVEAVMEVYETRESSVDTTISREFDFRLPPQINIDNLDLEVYEDRAETQSIDDLVENGSLDDITSTGPVSTSIFAQGDSLRINPDQDANGSYDVTVIASNGTGQVQETGNGFIEALADITGQILEGTTRDQIQATYKATGNGNVLVQGTTGQQGNFSFQLPPGANMDTLRFMKESGWFNRVVPFEYEANDQDKSGVKEVMFSMQPGQDVGLTPEETKQYAKELFFTDRIGIGPAGYHFWPQKPEFIALKVNPLTGDTLSSENVDNIEQIINEINDCTGRNYQMQVNPPGDTSGVDIREQFGVIYGEQGNIAVYWDDSQTANFRIGFDDTGATESGKIDAALVSISSWKDKFARQDFYLTALGGETVSNKFNSILSKNFDRSDFGPPDCQTAPYIRGEDYIQNDQLIDARESADNVLRIPQ